MSKIDDILEKYPFVQRDYLIPILQEIQDEVGYLNEDAIIKVGKFLNMPTTKIYGLATFYDQFRFEPYGKYHIKVCHGTSCHIHRSSLIVNEIKKQLGINENEVTKDKLFSYSTTGCLASCGQGPVVVVNDKYYTRVDHKQIIEIINYYRQLEEM